MWLRLLKIYVEIQQGSKHYLYLLYWRLQPNQYLKRNQKMMLTPPSKKMTRFPLVLRDLGSYGLCVDDSSSPRCNSHGRPRGDSQVELDTTRLPVHAEEWSQIVDRITEM